MAKSDQALIGLLLVDKPGLPQDGVAGDGRLPTSHDIVQRVRRLSGIRRIGHTGTLDPMATGLLLLCLGRATRLAEYYQGHSKRYTAEVTLGQETDTLDALGKAVKEAKPPPLDEDDIKRALSRFEGDLEQMPPLFSAIKQGGETLYRKARRGESVEVEPRPVTIHQISLLAWHPPARIEFEVLCSAGTYVRSLARDLGKELGVPAHLSGLRRTQIGSLHVSQAYTMDQIDRAAGEDRLDELLLPPGHGLQMPTFRVDELCATRLGQGQKVRKQFETLDEVDATDAQHLCCVDEQDSFLGILKLLEYDGRSALVKADKWLG